MEKSNETTIERPKISLRERLANAKKNFGKQLGLQMMVIPCLIWLLFSATGRSTD